jgi:Serine/threonine protein kinase
MEQLIGSMLDNRYEILSVVGTGGMAVVYKARCHKLNRLVAIKVLRADLARDAEFRRRFHDESQAVAMLSNPNIVGVYDVSSSDGLEYIVMELIDGITLKQYIQKKEHQLSWREALHFISQIMKALSHAHSRGIIHRDIKPHNIMVLRDGSVKVADFGIARLMSAGHSTLTQEALGSVHYISPEQAKGSRIDERSDIYSAGVVLYEMITGRLPFEGDSAVSVAIQHINSIPLAPRELNEEIPEALETITLKAMAPNMERRYPSADAMLLDLEQFRKNPEINFDFSSDDIYQPEIEPEAASPVSDTQVISGLGTAALSQKRPLRKKARPMEDAEEEEERGSWLPTLAGITAVIIFIVGIVGFLWTTLIDDILNPKVPEHDVPKLVGLLYNDVMNNPEFTDTFTINISKETPSGVAEPGVILSQTPDFGAAPLKGDKPLITVEVSIPEAGGIMPLLVNSELRAAEYKLKGSEFSNLELVLLPVEEEFHETITKNYIISTIPAVGEPLEKGAEVLLVVSKGPEIKTTTVISVIGRTPEQAEQMLRNAKLTLGSVVEQNDENATPGTILEQSPQLNESVPEGTSINVIIARERDDTTPVPPDVPIQITKERSLDVRLPSEPDSVFLVITVGGVQQYASQVSTNLRSISVTLQGTGTQEVAVYFDDVLYDSLSVDFS